MGLIIDLDQTIIDTSLSSEYRQGRKWSKVYALIPGFKLYDGMNEILKAVSEKGIRICVVTSSPELYCHRVLSHWAIPHDFTVCYHDTSNKKPHPEPIELAMYRLGERESAVITAGDKDIDIISSKLAGVKSIGCLWGCDDKQALEESKPDYVAKTVSEFKSILRLYFDVPL